MQKLKQAYQKIIDYSKPDKRLINLLRKYRNEVSKEQQKINATSFKLEHIVSIKEKTDDPVLKYIDEPFIRVDDAINDIRSSRLVDSY